MNTQAIAKDTDVYVSGERYLAFDNVQHAQAFATGFNLGQNLKKRLAETQLSSVCAEIAQQADTLVKLNLPTPWHAGLLEAVLYV